MTKQKEILTDSAPMELSPMLNEVGGAVKKKRHRWEKEVNHSHCHKYICKDCGCIKDAKGMTNTIYWLNDEKHFTAPNCVPIDDSRYSDTDVYGK